MQTGINYYVGIELSGSRKGFTCAILNSGLRIEFLGALTPLEWQTIIGNAKMVVAGVNSPLTMNLGYMADPEYRSQLKLANQNARTRELRVCEYLLGERGILCARSPKDVGKFSLSLQRSLKFASELGMLGFQFWPSSGAVWQMFESHADGAYQALLGIRPFPSASLEGRIQRQLMLQSKGIPVPDAMEFFEEVTRHRLLSGKLPEEKILSVVKLNALAAAFTAWTAASRPGECAVVGEADEGVIILPGFRKSNTGEDL
jgi:hypothetical protein